MIGNSLDVHRCRVFAKLNEETSSKAIYRGWTLDVFIDAINFSPIYAVYALPTPIRFLPSLLLQENTRNVEITVANYERARTSGESRSVFRREDR